MINKLSNIIEGWMNRFRKVHPIKEALFRDRLRICESNECGMYKLGICTACGCPVKAKTHSVMEECPENMWNPVMYEFEGILFFDMADMPKDVRSPFISWLIKEHKSNDAVGNTPCDLAMDWHLWLQFKEYLKELK